jgi:pyruvate,orthophosphate dikinase
MAEREICSLEYLIGTLATAYKGMITSLVARDFCILDGDGAAVLKGTVLAMPEGDYHAVLKHEGIELARAEIRRGLFELKAESKVVRESANLQIDIVQRGRHIGTFLLRKEQGDNLFISALELSEEVKGLKFGALSGRLRQKPGLLQKGEHIISEILSTKRDWGKFSEEIQSFSNDLFWYDRDSYYAWSEALMRFAFMAAEKVGPGEKGKTLENVLSPIGLALEKEDDPERLRGLTADWLGRVDDSQLDLSVRFRQTIRTIADIRRRFPDTDVRAALKAVLSSLEKKIRGMQAIPRSVLAILGRYAVTADLAPLERYGPARTEGPGRIVSDALSLASAGDYDAVFRRLRDIDPGVLDDAEMVRTLFDFFHGYADMGVTEGIADVFSDMVPVFRALPESAYKEAVSHISDMVRRLLGMGMTGECKRLLMLIKAGTLEVEDIVLNPEVAAAVLGGGDQSLVIQYKENLERYLIPAPGIRGFSGETWAEIADPLHLERLSRFLRIVALDNEGLRDVLVRLICNLYVSGVFIPDDRIFQREVSAYLNSARMDRDFLLHLMLLRRLPVFFSEVGASGDIREYTTEIDSWGNDPVLYFLRKQVHVNASNYNVPLIEKIMRAWVTGVPEALKDAVPEEVLSRLGPVLLEKYSSAAVPLFESLGIFDGRELYFEKIGPITEDRIRSAIREVPMAEELRSKFFLLLRIYQDVVKKYSRAGWEEDGDEAGAVSDYIRELEDLKGIVVSPEKTRAEESFYFKRHIAFGIPSVMGSYHEPKLDAAGEALRLEERVRVLFEGFIAEVEEKGETFSEGDVRVWIGYLASGAGLFGFHDLRNVQVDEIVTVLQSNALRLSQVVDLLRIWQKELTWMVESFHRTFHAPLVSVLRSFPGDSLPDRLRRLQSKTPEFLDKAADLLIREMMADVAGFLELDRFLNALIATLRMRVSRGDDIQSVPSGRQREKKGYYLFDDLTDKDAMELSPLIGGKAKNLACLRNRGMNVPAGAVFTADRALRYAEYTGSEAFDVALKDAVERIGERTGTAFGGDKKPLFLSVRSGSYISMPGILSSVLYCGMNDKTLRAFIESEGDRWLGWDSMRRFIEHYGTVVFGLDMAFFEDIVARVTGGRSELRREEVSADLMEAIVRGYRAALAGRRLAIPDDVYTQLKESVKSVYASWYSERSLRFREAMEISEHWGTSVTLMKMVCGNAEGCGASVFFTRNPFTLESGVYGDTREHATGGDLVYGKLINRPLSRGQGSREEESLEASDPELFALHEKVASRIEDAMGSLPQEVEVTYTKTPEGSREIHVLQTRRMEFHRGFMKRFSDVCRMQSNIIGRGAGVHGGALSGIATFSDAKEHISRLRELSGMPVILIRQMASTDDVSLMPLIDGIVTAGGGVASHASVLAQKFDLTAVVGCEGMEIEIDERGAAYAQVGGHAITDGSEISIDGSTGLIYRGVCPDLE